MRGTGFAECDPRDGRLDTTSRTGRPGPVVWAWQSRIGPVAACPGQPTYTRRELLLAQGCRFARCWPPHAPHLAHSSRPVSDVAGDLAPSARGLVYNITASRESRVYLHAAPRRASRKRGPAPRHYGPAPHPYGPAHRKEPAPNVKGQVCNNDPGPRYRSRTKRASARRRKGQTAYAHRICAMAITQIHTHRRNRHGSWRDGEGGTLDAQRPLGSCSDLCR